MNTEAVDVLAHSPQAAHEAIAEAWRICKGLTLAGKPVRIRAGEEEPDRTLEQNAFYWGVLLKDISEQAKVDGKRYTADAWHELGKRQFLGYAMKKVKVAGRTRATVIRRLRSTTDLTVRQFAKYLEELQAFAATDLGVVFSSSLNEG